MFDPLGIPDTLALSCSTAPPFSSNSCGGTLFPSTFAHFPPSFQTVRPPSTHQLLREALSGRVKHKMGTGRVSPTRKHL